MRVFKVAQARVGSHQVAGFYEETQGGTERQLLVSTAGLRCLVGLHAFCCYLLYRALVGRHMKAVKGSVWLRRTDVLPCRCYLRHCVLAARGLSSPAALASFLDNTFLARLTHSPFLLVAFICFMAFLSQPMVN